MEKKKKEEMEKAVNYYISFVIDETVQLTKVT